MTIHWGRLTEVGYVARHADVGERLERLGLKGFSPAQAVTALGQLILQNPVQMGVVRIDWPQWRRHYSPASLLLSHFADEAAADASRSAAGVVREKVLSADAAERPRLLETYIQRELGRVLRLDPSRVDLQRPLNTLGLDSLMAVELTTRIETDLGVTFPLATLTQGANVSQLAAQLLAILTDVAVPPGPAPTKTDSPRPPTSAAPGAAAVPADLDDLSDQQVDALLTEMLTKGEGASVEEHR